MIKRITGKWVFFLLISVLMYLVCTEYPNPFQDQSLSRATLGSKSFENGDTVLIFSSETVSVVTYLREHVKEFSVHIDDNRFWKSSDSFFHQEDLTVDPITILMSFSKTGWHKIIVTTTFKNDETKTETDSLFARSPLFQKPITAMVGDSIHLKTDPVKDDDVLYVWDFHDDDTPIMVYQPQYDFVLKNPISNLIGDLYVIDRSNHRSPLASFSTTASSASKLNIKSVNESLRGDTIYTGEPDLTLKILISGSFKAATVNELSFDKTQEGTGGIQLSKTFNNLDTLSGVMKAVVKAEDKSNESIEKTFYIKYDVNQTSLPVISVTFPIPVRRDTFTVMDSSLHMTGNVTRHSQYDKLFIKFSQNGFVKGYYKLLADINDWDFYLNLVPEWNKVRMDLTKDSASSNVIVSQEVQIKYDPTLTDLVPPKIKDFKINGTAISGDKSFTSNTAPALLTMTVLDNNTIKSVTVNNDTAHEQLNDLYSITINPEHKTEKTQYIIVATDAADNSKTDTISGLYNLPPRIESISIPSSMIPDSTYTFVVKVSDGDAGDKLVKTINILNTGRDTSITLVNDTISWKPLTTDTGKNTIIIRVSDGFMSGDVDTTVVSTVYQKTDKPLKVSWLTTADDFPDSIIVGKEQLSGQLKVKPNTGTGPFTYTVSIYHPSEVIYEGENTRFSWTPTRSDAGVRTLRCLVRDTNGESDTLDVLLTIIAHPSGVVYFTDQTMTINENSTNAAVSVRLSTSLADSVKVPYTIKFKSATAQDLNMIPSGIVWFAPGDTTVRLPINMVNDLEAEQDELFTIELSDFPALSDKDSIAVEKSNSAIDITIRDDDQSTVKYSFFGSAKSGSEKIKSDTIKVELDTILDRDIVITYAYDTTSNANDSDFTFASTDHSLKFKAGTKQASFVILITNDTKQEKDEVIKFKLQSTDPAAIPGTYTTFEYTIVDDDAVDKVLVMIQPPTMTFPEGLTPPGYPAIVLSKVVDFDITVQIRALESSPAKAGSDYSISGNYILVKAGTKEQPIGLKVNREFPNPPEQQETVQFDIISVSDNTRAEINPLNKTTVVTIPAN